MGLVAATLNNGATWNASTADGSASCLDVDGSNDYAVALHDGKLNLTNSFAILFRLKLKITPQTSKYFISKLNAGQADNNWSVLYGYTFNYAEFYAGGYSGSNPRTGSSLLVNDTAWHALAYKYTGVEWSKFLDGVKSVISANITFSLATGGTSGLHFGAFSSSMLYTNCCIDEVLIYKGQLPSDAEITAWQTGYTLPTSVPPVARWQFNEGSGVTAADTGFPAVQLTSSATSISEAAAITALIATLNQTASASVTVALDFSGTATTNSDYTTSGTAISIASGQTSGSISLTAISDTSFEGNETVVVAVSSVSGGSAIEWGTQQVTVTITDDDSAPTVTLSLGSSTIAENGGSTAVVATLSNLSTQDVTVNLSFAGTATNTVDYSRSGTTITVPAGLLTGSASVTAINDATFEGSETVVIDVSSVTNGTENGTQQVTVTITDSLTAPTVTLSLGSSTIAENGGSTAVVATLSNLSTQDVTVNLSFAGTATNTVDYSRSGTTITVPAGLLTGSASVTAINDATFEGSETVVIDVSSVTNGTENGTQQVTVTITDSLTAPTVTLSLGSSTIAENGGSTAVVATLSNLSTQDVTVNLSFAGTATNTVDYSRSGTTITVPAGLLTGSASVTAINDATFEGSETVVIDVSSVTNGTENGTQQVTVTITDNESAPTASVLQRVVWAEMWHCVPVFVEVNGVVTMPVRKVIPTQFVRGRGGVVRALLPLGPPQEADSVGELVTVADVDEVLMTVTSDGEVVPGYDELSLTVADVILDEPQGVGDPRFEGANLVVDVPAAALPDADVMATVVIVVNGVDGGKAWIVEASGPVREAGN